MKICTIVSFELTVCCWLGVCVDSSVVDYWPLTLGTQVWIPPNRLDVLVLPSLHISALLDCVLSGESERAWGMLHLQQSSSVHKVLHMRFRLYAYKVQLLQALQPNDKPRRRAFAKEMLGRIAEDEEFLKYVCFSVESTLHVSGKLNRQNVRIWGSQHPHETRD